MSERMKLAVRLTAILERIPRPDAKFVESLEARLRSEVLRLREVEAGYEDRMGQLARAKPEKMKKMLEDWGFKVPKRWSTGK